MNAYIKVKDMFSFNLFNIHYFPLSSGGQKCPHWEADVSSWLDDVNRPRNVHVCLSSIVTACPSANGNPVRAWESPPPPPCES